MCPHTPPPKHWLLGNLCVGSTIILPLFQHSLQDSVGSQRAPGHSGPGQGKPGDEGYSYFFLILLVPKPSIRKLNGCMLTPCHLALFNCLILFMLLCYIPLYNTHITRTVPQVCRDRHPDLGRWVQAQWSGAGSERIQGGRPGLRRDLRD